jgi:hypothetical protein
MGQDKTSFKLFAVSDLVQVFEDGYELPPFQDTLSLFGIQGEVLSGQCVIIAKKNPSDVTVQVNSLLNPSGEISIPAGNVAWNFVGHIPLSENAPNQYPNTLVRKAPAKFPDYLMAENQMNINKGITQAIWLTINIPKNAEDGIYYGDVIAKSNLGEQSIPLSLTVYHFQMPEERHMKVAEWFTTRHFKNLHGINEEYSREWFDMLRKYADNLVKHRQNVFQVPMNSIEIVRLENGGYNFDFTRFDQIARVFWNTGKMDYLETGELTRFGEEAWFSTDINFKNFTVFDKKSGENTSLPGMEVIPHLLPAFENHLRKMGWLDRTLFHVKDEPTLRNVTSWKEKSTIIHQYAPDLVRIDAIETTHLFEDIEIAIPKLDYLAGWHEAYKKAACDGVELWFYTVGIYQASGYPNKTIDMPIMDNRIMHWINYKYDLSGFLHWGWNQWTENPYKEVGMHIGDAWHVYPTKNGVLNSLRWEQMRNGLQDYEYLWILEDKIRNLKDSLGSRFTWIDPKQRGKEITSQVVYDFLNHTEDPAVLYKAKKEIIHELLNFNTSPRIYVQTNPRLNSTIVKERSYLVEVFGWAEDGTRVVVNGEELELSDQGMFLRNLKLSTEDNQVIVECTGEQGTKKIVREFIVEQ